METLTVSVTRGLRSSSLLYPRTPSILASHPPVEAMLSAKQMATEQFAVANLDFKEIHL